MQSWERDGKKGIVQSISGRGAVIKTFRGGAFKCHNEGFHVGQVVYYMTDALQQRIIALRKERFVRRSFIQDDFFYEEEEDWYEFTEDALLSGGQEPSRDFDFGGREDGDCDAELQRSTDAQPIPFAYGFED